ncbi:MAG: hypothetical protein WCV88_01010 [Patescibacteria group bacterium]|jgi:hypothetical protein
MESEINKFTTLLNLVQQRFDTVINAAKSVCPKVLGAKPKQAGNKPTFN